MEQERLCSALESMLFAAEHPVSLERFKAVFGENPPADEELTEALAVIIARYQTPQYGFELRQAQSGYHFVTKAANAEYIRTFLSQKPFRISRSALEVLAIIAYRQPVTRAEIDQVRGIDSSHLLRVLIERDIVRMAGKAEVPGRPVQYATTPRFLEIVGLNTLNDLPPLSELEQLSGSVPIKEEDRMETGLNKFMEGTMELEKVDEENQAEYREIHSLLETVQNADKEVFESQLHAEVAQENQAALEAFQASAPKKSRKKAVQEIRYEDLVVTDTVIAAGDVQLELPTEEPVEVEVGVEVEVNEAEIVESPEESEEELMLIADEEAPPEANA